MSTAAAHEDHAARRRARRSRSATASSSSPTTPSFPSSKATAPGRTSGAPACASWTPRSQKAYGGKRKIHWMEVYAGEKANKLLNTWLPDETVAACREYLVSIKGPLTTPVGGGIRSLNVALRQMLDLYVCLRPVRWFKGVPSPVKHPEKVDMVIFRENTEDIYAGIEFETGTEENKKFLDLFNQAFPKAYAKIRFPEHLGYRHQAGLQGRLGAPHPLRARVRGREQAQEPDAGPQGQHPEIHRRRLPQLGLPARRDASSPRRPTPGSSGSAPRPPQGEKDANAEMDAAKKAGKRHRQGCDRRHRPAAGADPLGRVRRDCDTQPQRRLPLGCARRAGRRYRHRAGRQHQLPDRPRGVRSDARHGAEVRQPRQGQSRARSSSPAR